MQDMQPDNMNPAAHGAAAEAANDREGAMAKADLYKLANYSLKLFKKMQDEDQLEGWVQAKITKAADYIASVYHYLEYEMEFSDYGAKLDNSEMYSESQKAALKNKLLEAKEKVATLKKLQAEKVKEDRTEVTKTQHGTATATYGSDGKRKGVVHKDERKYSDEEHGEVASLAKGKSASEKKADKEKDIKLPKPAKGTRVWGMKGGEKFEKTVKEANDKGDMDHDGKDEPDDAEYKQNKDVAIKKAMGKKEKKVDEAAKPDYIDLDKDGNKKESMKKAAKDKKAVKESECSVCHEDPCSCKEVSEGAPSAGMTKKEKSATVKAAKAGKDIGKPGKSFDKVAKAAGGGEKGQKIAAAAMWKNKAKSLKESLDAMSGEVAVEETAMDQMDSALVALMQRAKEIDPNGLQTAMQGGPEALDTFLKTVLSKIESKVDAGAQPGQPEQAAPTEQPAESQEQLAESAEFGRLMQFKQRLVG